MVEKIELAIIDDDREFCEIMEEFFVGREDFSLTGIANEAEAGIELVKKKKPDALVLDLIMPEKDGVEVLKQLKEMNLHTEIKIVVLTAFGKEKIIKEVSKLGADYYIMKPFSLEKLADRLIQLQGKDDDYSIPKEVNLLKDKDFNEEEESEPDIEVQISEVLHRLGVPAHIKGYLYLREAIKLVVEDIQKMGAVTKELYPSVADNFETTPSRVERAIRHAIDVAWEKGEKEEVKNYFGNTLTSSSGKPTNSQFIAKIADRLRLEMKK